MPTKTTNTTDPIERKAQQDERKRRAALKILRLPADQRLQVEAAIIEAQTAVEGVRS